MTKIPYVPLLDDPEYIRQLEGQRFVVLRAGPAIDVVHNQVQGILRRHLAGMPVSFPARAHVTLGGFAAGTALAAVQELVGQWARGVPPLHLTLGRANVFPSPFQVAFITVQKTADLSRAVSDLRHGANARGLRLMGQISVADWVFHSSLAYCDRLSPSAWSEVETMVRALEIIPAECVVQEVEVVAADQGREYSGGVGALEGPLPV